MNIKHHPLYNTWSLMKARCNRPTCPQYKDYGARGITVCNEWLNNFNQFAQDMGDKPTPKHTLERIDNNRGYSPDNCKWVTMKQQCANRRSTKLNYHQVNLIRKLLLSSLSLKDIGDIFGVSKQVIWHIKHNKTW